MTPGFKNSFPNGSQKPFTNSELKRPANLMSDALPFGRLWYGEPNAISNAHHRSRSHRAVIRVYDEAGNVIETHEHKGEFKEW
jgi:hypothetical protein